MIEWNSSKTTGTHEYNSIKLVATRIYHGFRLDNLKTVLFDNAQFKQAFNGSTYLFPLFHTREYSVLFDSRAILHSTIFQQNDPISKAVKVSNKK